VPVRYAGPTASGWAGPAGRPIAAGSGVSSFRFKPGFRGMCLFSFGPVNPVRLGQAEMPGLAFVSAFLTLVAWGPGAPLSTVSYPCN